VERPTIRVIDNQEEVVNTSNPSQSEMDQLLAKYGYKQSFNAYEQKPVNNLSFEDMVLNQELEERRIMEERQRRMNGVRPVSFSDDRVGYSEIKYSNIEVDSSNTFGIKIQIVTDMKI